MSTRRPPFLDWRYWICLIVAAIAAIAATHGVGLDQSNWRWLIYIAFGVVAGWAHEEWVDWLEATGRAKP